MRSAAHQVRLVMAPRSRRPVDAAPTLVTSDGARRPARHPAGTAAGRPDETPKKAKRSNSLLSSGGVHYLVDPGTVHTPKPVIVRAASAQRVLIALLGSRRFRTVRASATIWDIAVLALELVVPDCVLLAGAATRPRHCRGFGECDADKFGGVVRFGSSSVTLNTPVGTKKPPRRSPAPCRRDGG